MKEPLALSPVYSAHNLHAGSMYTFPLVGLRPLSIFRIKGSSLFHNTLEKAGT